MVAAVGDNKYEKMNNRGSTALDDFEFWKNWLHL